LTTGQACLFSLGALAETSASPYMAVLVDLAMTGSTYYDISPLSIDRPGIIRDRTTA
jgi:hypothetical protein